MTEKILFMVDSYEPTPSSNGVCVARLWSESRKLRYSHLLAMTTDKEHEKYEDDLWVCYYKRKHSSYFNCLFSFAQDEGMVSLLTEKAEEIIDKKGITTVLCTYRPVENLICALNLKRKYGEKLRVVTYYLDNLTEITSKSKAKALVFGFHQKRLIKKAYKTADSTLILKYYASAFKDVLGNETEKLVSVGLPAILKSENDGNSKDNLFSSTDINVVYAGSFYSSFRRPDKILKFLNEVCKLIPELKVHLYCWGCDDQVDSAKAEMGDSLILHGRVGAAEAHTAIKNADVLLNVGNDLPYQVPGKLFEYFSTGKPIVNFIYREDDPAKADYICYGNIFTVTDYGENDPTACAEFIRTASTLPWERVGSSFADSEPIYTINKIIKRRIENV